MVNYCPTVAAQDAKLGIRLTCANTDRINGWAEILQRFGDVDAGIRPTLFIHRRCARLLECLPGLQHDPNRPEDVLKSMRMKMGSAVTIRPMRWVVS